MSMTTDQIKQFHDDPKSIKDPNILIDEIEKQTVEIKYRYSRNDLTIAHIKSQFLTELAARLEGLMMHPKEIEVNEN